MAKRPTVPKFGTWERDNVGYTAYFDRVRENKGATAPPLHRPFNPNDPEEGPMMSVPRPSSSSRPATSGGRHGHQQRRPDEQTRHRQAGGTSSSASDPGGRGAGEQSKFAPPLQFQPRPSPQPSAAQHHGGGHHHQHRGGQYQPQHQPQAAHGAGGAQRAKHAQRHHHVHQPRARSASPQSSAPNRQRPSTVPKFGVWDEQTAESAAQGFTVQFENVKRHRDGARTAVPAVPRAPSPPEGDAARRAHRHQKTPFVSKMFGCFLPADKDRERRCI